jgi:hypothetical protein
MQGKQAFLNHGCTTSVSIIINLKPLAREIYIFNIMDISAASFMARKIDIFTSWISVLLASQPT